MKAYSTSSRRNLYKVTQSTARLTGTCRQAASDADSNTSDHTCSVEWIECSSTVSGQVGLWEVIGFILGHKDGTLLLVIRKGLSL